MTTIYPQTTEMLIFYCIPIRPSAAIVTYLNGQYKYMYFVIFIEMCSTETDQ